MTQTPNIPPVIESDERDYRDTGVQSTVAIAGHPLHPPLVTFPIALLVSAAGSDIGYWLTGDLFWARASFWLLGAGLLTGLAAAVVGMSDFLKIGRVRKHTAGWAHMYINVTSLILTLINFLLRFGSRTDNIIYTGLLISIVVATLLGIGGWFGGELIYRHKIAVIGSGNRE